MPDDAVDVLQLPSLRLELVRRPDSGGLRAYDAADALALNRTAGAEGTIVVLNDTAGALTAGLARVPVPPVSVSDSLVSARTIEANVTLNGLRAVVQSPREELPARIDVLVFRVPRTLALLEHQLHAVAARLHADSTVLGTGMVKQIHTSTLKLLESMVGPTRTSLATRKARLIHVGVNPSVERGSDPWPRTLRLGDDVPAGLAGTSLVQHAGVFSADHLDIGTRFLLQHLPGPMGRVVDLGCGNGVLGVAAGLADPAAQVVFTDESWLAVDSARASWRGVHGDRPAEFVVDDGMAGITGPVDTVLCNPPFHAARGTTDAVAWRMFLDARKALRRGGELRVVGNRHLGHHARLVRLFGHCDVVASNPKFVILKAIAR